MHRRWLLDFGSSTCRLIDQHGQITVVPSVAVVKDDRLLFMGEQAWQLIGKMPADAELVFPVQRGRVAEPAEAGWFLQALVEQVKREKWPEQWLPARHTALISSEISVTEKHHWQNLLEKSLGGSWQLVDRALALHENVFKQTDVSRQLIVEIGGQLTELAVFIDKVKIKSGVLEWGGVALTTMIQRQIAAIYQVSVSWQVAEKLKRELAFLPQTRRAASGKLAVRGKHLISLQGETLVVEASQLAPAVEQKVTKLAEGVKFFLTSMPTAVVAEVLADGITLAGGGALMPGLDERLSDLLQTTVRVVERPQLSAILGLQRLKEI